MIEKLSLKIKIKSNKVNDRKNINQNIWLKRNIINYKY